MLAIIYKLVKVLSPLLLCVSLFSALALLAKLIVNKLFGEKASQVIKKSSFVFVPLGLVMALWMLVYLMVNESILISDSNALIEILSTILFVGLILISLMVGLFCILLNILAFALLRFVIKHEKVVIVISIVSVVIWLISLGKNT